MAHGWHLVVGYREPVEDAVAGLVEMWVQGQRSERGREPVGLFQGIAGPDIHPYGDIGLGREADGFEDAQTHLLGEIVARGLACFVDEGAKRGIAVAAFGIKKLWCCPLTAVDDAFQIRIISVRDNTTFPTRITFRGDTAQFDGIQIPYATFLDDQCLVQY